MKTTPGRYCRHGALVVLCGAVSACGGGGNDARPAANQPPMLGALSFSVAEDTDLGGQLAASDPNGDALTWSRQSEPTRGTLVSFGTAGAFVYRPNANVSGSDSFSVNVADDRYTAVSHRVSGR